MATLSDKSHRLSEQGQKLFRLAHFAKSAPDFAEVRRVALAIKAEAQAIASQARTRQKKSCPHPEDRRGKPRSYVEHRLGKRQRLEFRICLDCDTRVDAVWTDEPLPDADWHS